MSTWATLDLREWQTVGALAALLSYEDHTQDDAYALLLGRARLVSNTAAEWFMRGTAELLRVDFPLTFDRAV